MTTGDLLKALLDIANLKQKSFAERMYTSPSKISKIISGKLLVSSVEANSFSEQAARIIADEVFENNCYFKFRDIFPVIFDFSSRYDLNDFLYSAFQYTIEQDRDANGDPSGLSHNNKYYSGNKQVLYMTSIILSDYLKADKRDRLVFYSSLQQFFGHYASLLDKLIILPAKMKREIIFHQLFDQDHFKTLSQEYKANILESLFESELYSDFYRWQVKVDSSKPFLLLEDKFIMLYDKQIDGTPQLTVICNRSELEHFSQLVNDLFKSAKQMSFNHDNIQDYFNGRRDETQSFALDEKLKTMLATPPAGSMPEQGNKQIGDLFDNMLKDEAYVYMSADSLESFIFNAEVIVPYYLTVDLSLEERIQFSTLIRDYVAGIRPGLINIINTQLNSFSVLCEDGLSLVSLMHPASKRVKYHLFASELIGPELKQAALESGISTSDYIDRLLVQAKKKHRNH